MVVLRNACKSAGVVLLVEFGVPCLCLSAAARGAVSVGAGALLFAERQFSTSRSCGIEGVEVTVVCLLDWAE